MILNLLFGLILSVISIQSQALEVTLLNEPVQTEGVTEYSYHFPDARPNMMQSVSYRIHNNSKVPIKITDFWVTGAYFDATSDCPKTMAPNKKCTMEIRYWPPFAGFHSGRVGLDFDDNNNLLFHVSGWCRE